LHNGLLLSEGEYWKQQRTLLSPGFHYFYLQEMVPIIGECIDGWCRKVEGMIDAAAAATGAGADAGAGNEEPFVELEMSHEMATMTLDSVATAAFGAGFRADPLRADKFIHALKDVLDAMQARSLNLTGFLPIIKDLPLPSLRTVQRGCATIDAIVAEIVSDRKAGRNSVAVGGEHAGSAQLRAEAEARGETLRRRDLLDLLLDAQTNMPSGQVLTDQGVQEESLNFIAAGAETTSNLCIWMLWRILIESERTVAEGLPREESIFARVVEEIDRVCPDPAVAVPSIDSLKDLKYLEAVTYEALRLHPPAPSIPKLAIEAHDVVYEGRTVHVPVGTIMLINANVIHRLPEYWPEPEVFKPERFLSGAVASAAGASSSGSIGAQPSPSPPPASSESTTPATTGSAAVPSWPTTSSNDAVASSAASSSSSVGASPSPVPSPSPRSGGLTAAEKARKLAAPFAFLGFSAGPRKCIGKNLAMVEIKIIFAMLLQRFAVVPDQIIAANPITRLPKHGIRMRVMRRKDRPDAVAAAAAAAASEAPLSAADATASPDSAASLRQRANLSVLKPTGMI
jgi:cytochrome P450